MKQLLFVIILASACTPPQPAPEPPHFLWSEDAQSLDNPFPDERLIGTGGLRPRWFQPFLPAKAVTARSASYFNKIGAQFAREVTATGSFGATLLPLSEPLDPDSLINCNCVVRMVRADDGSWQVLERNVAVDHPRDTLAKRGYAFSEGTVPEFLTTRPTIPLPELHDGMLVVLKGPKTKTGTFLGRSAKWSTAHAMEFPLIAAALTVSPDEVIFMVPQRAGNITAAPKLVSSWADANPPAVTIPPHAVVADENNGTRPVGTWTPSDSDWSVMTPWLERHAFARPVTHVGRVVIGEFSARDLRENGLIKPEWVANPSSAPVVPLRFVLTLPSGPKPAGGWPVVMGQHGVNARNTPRTGVLDAYCLEWAEPLAARGLGCIGIDAPNHGSRGNFTGFFTVDDLPALRDRMREMTFDLLQVESGTSLIDVDADGTPDLAPRVRYFGNSMGAIMGSGFIPVSNRVSTAVLNVPGAGLSNVVMSRFLQDLIGLLIVAQTDIPFDSTEYISSFPLFRAVAQPLFDPGDPVNVAPAVKDELAVLLQAGVGDKVIPLDTSNDLASALRLTAPVAGNRHAFNAVVPQKFGEAADYNGHNVIWDIPVIRDQALTFLETDGATLTTP